MSLAHDELALPLGDNAAECEINPRRGALFPHRQPVIPQAICGRVHQQQQPVSENQFLVRYLFGPLVLMAEDKVPLSAQGEAGNGHVPAQLLLVVLVEAHLVFAILVPVNKRRDVPDIGTDFAMLNIRLAVFYYAIAKYLLEK